jgi:hypothetical protein
MFLIKFQKLIVPCFVFMAVAANPCLGAERDSIPFRHHRFQIDPLSLLGGSILANYEFKCTPHNALAVEGSYTLPLVGNKGMSAGIQYRYYYTSTAYAGIFGHKGEMAATLPAVERGDTTKYAIELSYATIGVNWGKAWYIKKRYPFAFRIGAGYPVTSIVTWKNDQKYPNARLFENFFRFSSALDSELSIGVSF